CDGLVGALPQRIGPGLARQATIASGVELLAITEGRGQVGVEPAAGRYRAGDVLARVAVGVKGDVRRRAKAVAKLLVLREPGRHGGIGNWEIVAVAGPHAERPVGARKRSIGRGAQAAEQAVEKAARSGVNVLPVLRSAIILPERHQDAPALVLALAAIALQPLDLRQGAVEIGAHLLDLIVERTTLRRLSAEQGEKAGAVAPGRLVCVAGAVGLGLCFGRGVLGAFALFGLAGIDRGTAFDGGELAFEPQAHRVARAATRPCVGNGRTRSGSAWRRRGAERKTELRRRRGSA